MELFINGVGLVSPQRTKYTDEFLGVVSAPAGGFYRSEEPAYKEHLNVNFYRRLSRVLKMSLLSAKWCLQDAQIEQTDGIIVGTGLGCLEETENFLVDLLEHNEELLSPTHFIQSTHNTISSQAALYFKCYGYNVTFAHRIFSFEHALVNGYLTLMEHPAQTLLVGGADEITERLFAIKKNIGMAGSGEQSDAVVPGEGCAYFSLTAQHTERSVAVLRHVTTYHAAKDAVLPSTDVVLQAVSDAGLKPADIGLILRGDTGRADADAVYAAATDSVFPGAGILPYKKLCGEYCTASSFALALAVNILKYRRVPEPLAAGLPVHSGIDNILIYNQTNNSDHSIIIVSAC